MHFIVLADRRNGKQNLRPYLEVTHWSIIEDDCSFLQSRQARKETISALSGLAVTHISQVQNI